jgi:hypothetical protein
MAAPWVTNEKSRWAPARGCWRSNPEVLEALIDPRNPVAGSPKQRSGLRLLSFGCGRTGGLTLSHVIALLGA